MNLSSSYRSLFLIGLVLLGITWFADIQFRELTHTDEGRYAEIPREMVVTGDWLTPRLNEFKYFEKPPLHYWATAVAYEVFGIHIWTGRLWTVLSGFLIMFITAYAAYRLYSPRAAILTILLLAGNVYYYLIGHINVLDTGLTLFMTLTLVGFLLAQSNPQEYRRWMLLAWAGAAGALMSKGLMGFILPGAVFVLYSLIQRDPGIWTRLNFWAGLIVFLMLGAPWFILVSMANPEFVEFFFIHEHFNRFFTKVHQRYEPWYYFLAYTALAILPWIPQLTGLLKNTLKAILPLDKSRFNPELFLLIWAVFIVFFFSISSSKLPHYIMPVMPAIALLYARYFDNDEVPHLSISALITLIIGVGGMGISFINNPKLLQFSDWLPWMRVGFVILIIGGATTLFLRHASAFKRIAVLCISWYLTTLIILASAQSVSEIRSAWPLLKDHAHKIQPEDPVYSVEYYQQTVPFYLGRTVTLVNYMGELEFGIHQEPEKYIPSTETFKELWLADDRAFAVMKLEVYEPLATEGLPMKELSRDRKFILVEKP